VRRAQPVAQPAQTLIAALAERREREAHRVLADVGEQIDRYAPPGPQLRHEAVFAWEARRFLRFAARLAIGTARSTAQPAEECRAADSAVEAARAEMLLGVTTPPGADGLDSARDALRRALQGERTPLLLLRASGSF